MPLQHNKIMHLKDIMKPLTLTLVMNSTNLMDNKVNYLILG